MMENFSGINSLANQNPRPNRRKSEEGIESEGRRKFMKCSAFLAGTFLSGKKLLELSQDFFAEGENFEKGIESNQDSKNQNDSLDKEQLKIKEDNIQVVRNTVEEQLLTGDKVELDVATKKAIYEKWLKSYSEKPGNCPKEDEWSGENHLGLLETLEKMKPWIADMKKEFVKIGLAGDFAYLAIPESHFKIYDVSGAYAKGPFQFTKGTAKNYGLLIEDGIDERLDPIMSARACAEHLRYSYKEFNNDWRLALADYNGGYTNKYAKFRSKKEDRNYEDYLTWREGRINEFMKKDFFEYKVESGQNLTVISKKWKMSVSALKKVNDLKSNAINAGQILKIPAIVSRKINFLENSLENLNYPEKFYAILDVIEKEKLKEEFLAESLKFNWKKIPKVKTTDFSYVIKKGENLFLIARKIKILAKNKDRSFNLSVFKIQALIQRQNGISDPRKIRLNQKLKIELPLENGPSLKQVAIENKIKIETLQKLNYSILNADKSLPAGIKIRIPV